MTSHDVAVPCIGDDASANTGGCMKAPYCFCCLIIPGGGGSLSTNCEGMVQNILRQHGWSLGGYRDGLPELVGGRTVRL